MTKALVIGIKAEILSKAEKELLSQIQPAGVILFSRNCQSKPQVSQLIQEIKSILDPACLILIDQEGGLVTRLKPPIWSKMLAMQDFGQLNSPEIDYWIEQNSIATASMLKELGINANCAPVLDLCFEYTHKIIANRSLGSNPRQVAKLAEIISKKYLEQGVLPIAKHFPGLGRAQIDTHHSLPTIQASYQELAQSDFIPFMNCSAPIFMVAHIALDCLNTRLPLTVDKASFNYLKQSLGLNRLFISDCIRMQALKGKLLSRAKKAFEAGLDLVLCSDAKIDEYYQLAEIAPEFKLPPELKALIDKNPKITDYASTFKKIEFKLSSTASGNQDITDYS